jgi:hypothetical protein
MHQNCLSPRVEERVYLCSHPILKKSPYQQDQPQTHFIERQFKKVSPSQAPTRRKSSGGLFEKITPENSMLRLASQEKTPCFILSQADDDDAHGPSSCRVGQFRISFDSFFSTLFPTCVVLRILPFPALIHVCSLSVSLTEERNFLWLAIPCCRVSFDHSSDDVEDSEA